jgi:hypothetical protein
MFLIYVVRLANCCHSFNKVGEEMGNKVIIQPLLSFIKLVWLCLRLNDSVLLNASEIVFGSLLSFWLLLSFCLLLLLVVVVVAVVVEVGKSWYPIEISYHIIYVQYCKYYFIVNDYNLLQFIVNFKFF